MRRGFADISIASWPHPQRPNEEAYFHIYLGHDGQDHGMATFSIFRQASKSALVFGADHTLTNLDRLRPETQPPSCQDLELIRKRKFDRICAWLAEDVKKIGNAEMEFIQGERLPSRLLDVGTMKSIEACCSSNYHEHGSLRLIHTKDAEYGQLPVPGNSRRKHYSSLNPKWVYYAVLSH